MGWIALKIFTPRGRVAWGVSHQHAFYLQNLQPPTLVYTKEIWIQNVGRAPVSDVEVIFAATPDHFDIWPQRNFTTTQNPNGNLVIKVDSLNKREYFTISMLQTAVETPLVTNVRWTGGVGKQRAMAPQQVYPKSVLIAVQLVILFGVFSMLYFLLRILSASI